MKKKKLGFPNGYFNFSLRLDNKFKILMGPKIFKNISIILLYKYLSIMKEKKVSRGGGSH